MVSEPLPTGFQRFVGIEGGRVAGKMTSGIQKPKGPRAAGCYQKVHSLPFRQYLTSPTFDKDGVAWIGPLPNILDYYREAGLAGRLHKASRHAALDNASGAVAFAGATQDMVMPSLDASPMLQVLGQKILPNVTVTVQLNSNSACYGLAIEASPLLNRNGWRDTPARSSVVVRPAADRPLAVMEDGQSNILQGKLPLLLPDFKLSGARFHTLAITVGHDGHNRVMLTPASSSPQPGTASLTWRHMLFDGRDIPAVYAITHCHGSQIDKVFVGQIRISTLS